jgi:hypothetical protein
VCLGLVERTHVVDILREAEPRALHVTEITTQNGLNCDKLCRPKSVLTVSLDPLNSRYSACNETARFPTHFQGSITRYIYK